MGALCGGFSSLLIFLENLGFIMTVLKVSFMLRSPSVGWDYKSANKSALSDDLANALAKESKFARPVDDIKGSVQFNFYVATESDAEQQKAAAKRILESLIKDEKVRGMVIVTVTEPDEEEIEKLRKRIARLKEKASRVQKKRGC
jgi:polyhydroxyalkanoate synthesis regulator phasin